MHRRETYVKQQATCPCCSSTDIDRKRQECRACHVGLPDGSFDVHPQVTPSGRNRNGKGAAFAFHSERQGARHL